MTDDAFVDALIAPDLQGIVWEVSTRAHCGQQAVVAIRRAVPRVPILLRTDLRVAGAAALVLEIARIAGDLTVSLAGQEPFDTALGAWLERPSGPPAEHSILKRIAPLIDASIQSPLVAAMLARRRTSVALLASLCGCSVRTLQLHLANAGLPNPRVLLGWSLALHTSWRLEVSGLSVKQAAAVGHLRDSAQLSNYIWRHVGERPMATRQNGGFWGQLERFAALLPASMSTRRPGKG